MKLLFGPEETSGPNKRGRGGEGLGTLGKIK